MCFDIRYANIQKYDTYKLYLMMITHEIALDNFEYESRGCKYSGLKTTFWHQSQDESMKRIQCPISLKEEKNTMPISHLPEKSFIHINLGFFTLYFDLPFLWFGIPKKGKPFDSAKLKRRKNVCTLLAYPFPLLFYISMGSLI